MILRILLIVAVLGLGAACTKPQQDNGVASAGGGVTTTGTRPAGVYDPAKWIKCLREHGLTVDDPNPNDPGGGSRDEAVEAVRAVLAATANPGHPNEVLVSRPSDALAAKRATEGTLGALLLGLGAVALLVGGVGVANTMVISVLERSSEIGLRRALGATRGQIRTQFLAESLLLSALGGLGGALLGIAVTSVYSATGRWPAVVPPWGQRGRRGRNPGHRGARRPLPGHPRRPPGPIEALATA